MSEFGHSSLRSLCAALLPPEVGGPDPDRLATLVGQYVRKLPSTSRGAAMAGIVGLSGALRIAAKGRRLDRLPMDRRTALLERAMDLRPESYAAVEGIKAVVLLAYGADHNREYMLERGRRFEPYRPDPELDVTPSSEWPSTTSVDAVIVGSGAGGAMVARTLSRSGMSVVVVEEGRRWTTEEFRSMSPIDRFANLYRDAGSTMTLGNPPIVLPIGRAVGGTTVVNSGTCYRPPHEVMVRWRDNFGLKLADPELFAPYLDEVEETLGVAPAPLDVLGPNGERLLAGAKALGWEARPLRRNATGCVASCQCAIGCPRGAKAGVHLNALPQACEAGARILSEAKVVSVLNENGRARGIVARRRDGSEVEILAPVVVVAAGAAETPSLLWRSNLGGHPQVGRNLAIHPAVSTAGRFDETVTAWEGILQSAAIEEFHESHGILIEATSTPPGMGSMLLPGVGKKLVEGIDGADHLASFGAMIGDESVGRVRRVRGRAIMSYQLTGRDGKRLVFAMSVMGRALFAAGAHEVLTGVPGEPPARNETELEDILGRANPKALHLAAFHPTGTARAGADDQTAPVDPTGRLRGVDGVWVADACVIPSCPEVNPQVSIMAMALAVADTITQP